MEEMIVSAMGAREWKGYDYNELRFKALVARTKFELGKAMVEGQYQQMTSSDNAGSQMVTRVGDYMRYATYAMKAFSLGKKIWKMFKNK